MFYDSIIIGGGTAGRAAYRKLEEHGLNVLLIDNNNFKTTCASVGCMPSKVLIASSDHIKNLYKSNQFGVDVNIKNINIEKILERVRFERDRFVGFVNEGTEKIKNKIYGYANVINNNLVEVNNNKFNTKTILFANGSSIFIPDILKPFANELLNNENIFEQKNLPKKIVIFGLGVIGLEIGSALKQFGIDVLFISNKDNILNLSNEVSDYVKKLLIDDGIKIEVSNNVKIEKINDLYNIHVNNNIYQVNKIFNATGRKSNIDLNLLKSFNEQTMHLKDNLFACGDVTGNKTVLHEAAFEGNFAAENIINYLNNKTLKKFKRNVSLNIVFTYYPIMQIGETKKYFKKGSVSFENQGKSRILLKNKGILNLYFNSKDILIGAEMVGPNADNIAHLLNWSIEKKVKRLEMLNFSFYHPVVEEGIKTALRNIE